MFAFPLQPRLAGNQNDRSCLRSAKVSVTKIETQEDITLAKNVEQHRRRGVTYEFTLSTQERRRGRAQGRSFGVREFLQRGFSPKFILRLATISQSHYPFLFFLFFHPLLLKITRLSRSLNKRTKTKSHPLHERSPLLSPPPP